jgi:PEP-CTERM motif
VFADQKFNGPDFKVIAKKTAGVNAKSVPEPTTILGLGMVSGLAFVKRKKNV